MIEELKMIIDMLENVGASVLWGFGGYLLYRLLYVSLFIFGIGFGIVGIIRAIFFWIARLKEEDSKKAEPQDSRDGGWMFARLCRDILNIGSSGNVSEYDCKELNDTVPDILRKHVREQEE